MAEPLDTFGDFEFEFSVFDAEFHLSAVFEIAKENLFGQRRLDLFGNDPAGRNVPPHRAGF